MKTTIFSLLVAAVASFCAWNLSAAVHADAANLAADTEFNARVAEATSAEAKVFEELGRGVAASPSREIAGR